MEYIELIAQMEKINLMRRLFLQEANNECGLYAGQFPVLHYVFEHDKCTQIEIADNLSVTPASIATSTKRLQKAGLLVKEVDEENLRCKKISLTQKGKEVTHSCGKRCYGFDKRMFEGFSKEEMISLNSFFERILNNTIDALKEKVDIDADGRTVPALVNIVERKEKKLKEENDG